MTIAVDVGNTTTALAALDGARVKHSWRIMTQERTGDEYAVLFSSMFERSGAGRAAWGAAGICSVVPSEVRPVAEALVSVTGLRAEILDGTRDWGVVVETDNPAEVGADRIANAVGAYYEHGGPAIVVDIGTATTFDVVSANGHYRGGVIAPGMLAAARDLWTRARMLPQVEIRKPARTIGRTTVQCMESGIFFGTVGQIEGVVRRMWQEMGGECLVLMTGGYAALVAEHLSFKTVLDVGLTLKGIAYAIDPALRQRPKAV